MRPRGRGWDKSYGWAPGDSRSPATGPGEEGRPVSIFVLFVTNRQLFRNYQPFWLLKMWLFCPLPAASSAGNRGRPQEGKRQTSVAPSLFPAPTQEPAPTQISATKATTGQWLFKGFCLWWFLLSVISLYHSRQLAGSHLILIGRGEGMQKVLSAIPEKP